MPISRTLLPPAPYQTPFFLVSNSSFIRINTGVSPGYAGLTPDLIRQWQQAKANKAWIGYTLEPNSGHILRKLVVVKKAAKLNRNIICCYRKIVRVVQTQEHLDCAIKYFKNGEKCISIF